MNSSCKCCGQVASLKCSKCADFHTCSAKSCIESKAWIGHALICGKDDKELELILLNSTVPRFKDRIKEAWNKLHSSSYDKYSILWKIATYNEEISVVHAWKEREDNSTQDLFIWVNHDDFSVKRIEPFRILPDWNGQYEIGKVKVNVRNSYLEFAEWLIQNGWNIHTV